MTLPFVRSKTRSTVPPTERPTGYLGCGTHTVAIQGKGGHPPLGPLESVASLSWGRVLDDTSEASVVVNLTGNVSTACCELLRDVEPWCHEVQFLRDGAPVWEGPVTGVVHDNDAVTISASDISAWLDVRPTHDLIDLYEDLSTIALAVITDALAPDDPGVLDFLSIAASGVLAERTFEPFVGYAGEYLRELARTGLDYTVLGRRLVIAPEEIPATPIGTITNDHIMGPVQVIKDGKQTATKWYVVGEDVDLVGIAGGSSWCGLVERIAREQSIEDFDTADRNAAARLAASNPTPRIISVPAGSRLAPHTPIPIEKLVPGALVTVAVSTGCLTEQARFRLQAVTVTEGGAEGEAVSVTLSPVGRTA